MRTLNIAMLVVAASVNGLGLASSAVAQQPDKPSANAPTPKGWNYEIRGGKRVPKGERVTNADGSWREEIRQGNCITVREKNAAGEYRETRHC